MITVKDVYQLIDSHAPFASQMPGDHSGLQVGALSRPVSKVLVALDMSNDLVDEALELGCDLIVTHHPFIWNPLPDLDEDMYAQSLVARLVREGISYIAAHTNVDGAPEGHNVTLAKMLDGKITGRWPQEECVVLFDLEPILMSELLHKVQDRIDPRAYAVGQEKIVTRAAVCSGAGGSDELVGPILEDGRVYISGEFKHHQLRYADDIGGNLIGFGHFRSEIIFTNIMAEWLAPHVEVVKSRQQDPGVLR